MITQEGLNEMFYYDGFDLYWAKPTGRMRVGDLAGTNSHGYRQVQINKKLYRVHRVIWFMVFGHMPYGVIDHINGNRSDNRLENLRDVTYKENNRNQKISKINTSGMTGVSWNWRRKKYSSYFWRNGKQNYLGFFSSYKDAVNARLEANKKHGFHKGHGKSAV
jgi:hypothetical protein